MGGLTLLREARDAGLDVYERDGRLVIHGPRSAERMVEELMARKGEVLTHLRDNLIPFELGRVPPDVPCRCCGAHAWWRRRSTGTWTCGTCYPPAVPEEQIERHSEEDGDAV